MDNFDAMQQLYVAGAPMSLQGVPGAHQQMGVPMMPGALDQYEQHSAYDPEAFATSEDLTFSNPGFHPQLQRAYTNTYDDHYSDDQSYVQSLHPDHNALPESPSMDRDHKLLGFSPPTVFYRLYQFPMREGTINISAQLHGMFFLAESVYGDAAQPTELTCYRRNLFQITGTILMPRNLQTIITEQGEAMGLMPQVPVELTISATESLENNSTKIISVPWKTPPGSTQVPEDKTEKEPPSHPLDLSQGKEIPGYQDHVSLPISWKRLQFRSATANNGRRKELQQHYIVRIQVMATLVSGARIPICEVHSSPIIVRGRSPRNFQSRRDIAISAGGSASGARKPQLPHQPSRTPTGDTNQTSHSSNTQTNMPSNATPTVKPESLQMPLDFGSSNLGPVSPDFLDWKVPTGPMRAIAPDTPSLQMQNLSPYAQSTPEIKRAPAPRQASSAQAPISLSLTDDDPVSKKGSSPSEHTKKQRATPGRVPSFSVNPSHSPGDSSDLLYEYFPLPLDDWMPPVDAVYRPHVVHHTNLPDPQALAVKNKSKRYFSDVWGNISVETATFNKTM